MALFAKELCALNPCCPSLKPVAVASPSGRREGFRVLYGRGSVGVEKGLAGTLTMTNSVSPDVDINEKPWETTSRPARLSQAHRSPFRAVLKAPSALAPRDLEFGLALSTSSGLKKNLGHSPLHLY